MRRPDGRKRRRPVLRIAALIALLAVLAGGVTGCMLLDSISGGLPDPTKPLKGTDLTTRVLDRNGKTITDLFAEQNRRYVPFKDIPAHVREAVIATEDQRYYEHPGVDLVGMLRAIVVDIKAGAKVQGGSTITQQYVKQAFVGDESTLKRKISEALLAYRLEQRYDKDRILEMYLNTIYFGHGAYGVETAAQAYFGKPVQQLDVAEAAMLAGVIKSPGRYSPYLDPEAAKDRRATVLAQMLKQGYVDTAGYEAAIATEVKTSGRKRGSKLAPYFVEYLKEQLVAKYGEAAVYRGGLRVTTTLDLKAQAAAEKAVSKTLDRKSDPSAAVVALDPKTGQIIAMVGGRDFTKQQYNAAVQGKRQSGSAFKPFVLAAALREGVSPEEPFRSGAVRLKIPGGQTWSVTGAHSGGTNGKMRLREATWRSVNSVFAQLVLRIGADEVVDTARDLGITTKITPVPAVALGGMAEGVSPLEMASAYGTLANGGERVTPTGILEVADSEGTVLYTNKTVSARAIDPATAYLTTDILRDVIQKGTGTAAGIGRPAAGKTGTTQKYRDAWFCGYTPDLVAAVWVGYVDSQKEMTSVHGIPVTGGSFPARIWASFMRNALDGTPETRFKRPSGLVNRKICLETGAAATEFCPKTGSGLFLADHAPDACTVHTSETAVKMPNLVGMPRADAIAALTSLAMKYSIVEKDVAGVEAGTVAAQNPSAGSAVATGTVVTITVSTGGSPPRRPPAPSFDWTPASPKTSTSIRFDAGTSTSAGSIAAWTWDFGDGVKDTSSGAVASHRYATAGTYQVTLTVKDDAGVTVSLTRRVTVR